VGTAADLTFLQPSELIAKIRPGNAPGLQEGRGRPTRLLRSGRLFVRANLNRFGEAVCALLFVMAVAACGSGNHFAGTAEGFYAGTLSGNTTSTDFQLIVLETGEFWTLYGGQTSTKFNVAGFTQGNGVSNNGSFTSSNTTDFGFNPPISANTTATYNAGAKTISGTISEGSGSVAFSGGPITGATYNYNTPASLSILVGSWLATTSTPDTVILSIATDGTFTATGVSGCNFSGTFTPRVSGKNVFNVSLTFGATNCASPNQTTTGIAIAYPLASGPTQLLIGAVDSTRTFGTAVFGTK
jgi:hypothetical protein